MHRGPPDVGVDLASHGQSGRDAGAPEEGAALLQQLAAGAAAGGRFGDAARHMLALALVGMAPPAPPAAAPGAPAGQPAASRPAPTTRALALFWERLGTAEAYAAYQLVHAATLILPYTLAPTAVALAAPGPAPAPGPAAAPLHDLRASSRAEALNLPAARAGGARQAAKPLGLGGPAQAAGPGDGAGAPGGGGPQAAAPRGRAAPATTLLNAAHFLLAHLPPVRRSSCDCAPVWHIISTLVQVLVHEQSAHVFGRQVVGLHNAATSQRRSHAAPTAAADTHARRLSRPIIPVLGVQKASAPFPTWCAGGAHGI